MKKAIGWLVVLASCASLAAEPRVPAKYSAAVTAEESAKTWRLLARDLKMWNRPRDPKCARDTSMVPNYQPPANEVVNAESLIQSSDRDPLDVLVRRTRALYADLKDQVDLTAEGRELDEFVRIAAGPANDADLREMQFRKLMRLRKRIAWKNPLVQTIKKLLFVTREPSPLQELNWGTHICDQFFGFHARAKESSRGDGLWVLENPFSDEMTLVDLLADKVVEKGPWKGRKLIEGPAWDTERICGFLSPDVSWDGNEILFCATRAKPDIRVWNDDTVFHIFKCRADGSHLEQLTTGNVNDLFPCWLPNGRVAFVSERRGGYGRCHRREVPNYTLYSMFPNGSDITCLSYHETNEFEPSVDNNGMIVYTRWDYVDRGFNQAHHGWITYPDGRDPRDLNGNTRVSEWIAPHAEHSIRAIPNSRKYVATAAGHHTLMRGSLVMIDPSIPDDDKMSQVKRITPDQLFPEAEAHATRYHHSGAYATAWPLSEKYFLCVYDGDANSQYGFVDPLRRKYNLTLLDVFGNKIEIFAHPQISCLDPMPLQARKMPPVIPHRTLVGRPKKADGSAPDPIPPEEIPRTAQVSLVNVYNSRHPLPEGVKIAALRVWQLLPKGQPFVARPRLGVCDQHPGRQCLGTVPVEADGSAYFTVPVDVPIFFQALDAEGCAVQTMRSDTYTAPGELLSCNGCHEQRPAAMLQNSTKTPLAMKRAPSALKPEVEGSKPFNYPRLVQPVLDRKCISCHGEKRKETMPDLRRGDTSLNPFGFYTSFVDLIGRGEVQYYTSVYKGKDWYKVGRQRDAFVQAYSEPGKVGARGSKLYQILKAGHHGVQLTEDEWRRLILFMDAQGSYIAHDFQTQEQLEGKVVEPILE